eukprot:TRINITY_DN8744_c0_g1_i1.p1 TRINITY_DN8744_c0_g1~~TRINITY_DN8744_c0_g1_i1.p1  ORF type:complete len:191 (+),score=32.64 TRINITY_DN8744_c0_g1_i1:77-649(+)
MDCTIARPHTWSDEDVDSIIAMVNEAYDFGEGSIWKDGFQRTTREGIVKLLKNQCLLVARDTSCHIAGCIKLNPDYRQTRFDGRTPAKMAELGMLAVRQDLRRQGLGLKLVQSAIATAKQAQCDCLELQLVKPRDWKHEIKEFLERWYQNLGFVKVGVQDDAEDFFRVASLLATPVVIDVYELDLSTKIN